jgi:NAD(P)-dependent dehydrogenase (short-subunit alcohol dehydrogenase family)
VSELGTSALGVRGDVSDLSDLDRLYKTIRERYGTLDILFANAGGGAFTSDVAIPPRAGRQQEAPALRGGVLSAHPAEIREGF